MIPSLRSVIVLAVLAQWGVAQNAPLTFCFPNTPGVLNCPCGNPPEGLGSTGCNNFGDASWGHSSTGGAMLYGDGFSSISSDTLDIEALLVTPFAFIILLESSNSSPSGTIYGAGICCLTSPMHLVYGQNGIRQSDPLKKGFALWGPETGDPSISSDIGATSGQITYFQALYRDPYAFTYCQNPNSTFNLTNAVSVTWVP